MIPVAKPLIGEEEIEEVEKVLRSGFIAQGPKVAEFEEAFANYVGAEHAVATSSGTTALHVALLALGVGKGDEVITTPFSFAATGNCALYVGARPVFVDIDPSTFNLDPEGIEDAITEKTKAILPVHLYGQPARMDRIMEISQEHGIPVVEDAAQAHGAKFQDQMIGSIGDMACFSFYPTKNMTTSEGGMITTNSSKLADQARILKAHGERERYQHSVLGYNFRMTDIAAAIGLVQLKKLNGFNQKRIENAEYLTEHLKGISCIESPFVSPQVKHVFHQYTVRVKDGKRNDVMNYLNQEGIGTGIHYPIPIYKQELYQNLGYNDHWSETEKAASEVLSLPVHPSLSVEELEKIVITLEAASDKFF
ncbi:MULTISPECIES: DegT/DnrJ/EryC1/StrS aminotransferase family protein [Methanobacterium]|jgi:dTDP-4-amino-4,6-dideoxygalactose transaminase|uniref:DegT/DnrJ/EryC1/StrS family aminotransferase n=1 Tax=Methanobacterium formicicum TaxID=2162 RepID=A0A843AKZ3_METFO|nr:MULTISPECIES: DegT/DnrJ/EryC1/StrS family aminotransferase [Methanobacterium]KUK75717.1 MAG: Glutamine--scyllo-inositol transaminase [Methanobacterium sp. 42_16]MBF4475539.1 DegT/DnrJ/EryC1/StrS family aminotransferase [Methanobacterium formicicum]MDD4810573.1 DegT/DnrJ/EryC1/StrS family aminotransferase [Methanobacterium formicicum]MDG3548224.1 DegT/DnrJ/EryC1/StrS family aminotransferase [Methanobacterium formicicum]